MYKIKYAVPMLEKIGSFYGILSLEHNEKLNNNNKTRIITRDAFQNISELVFHHPDPMRD